MNRSEHLKGQREKLGREANKVRKAVLAKAAWWAKWGPEEMSVGQDQWDQLEVWEQKAFKAIRDRPVMSDFLAKREKRELMAYKGFLD